MAKLQWRWTDVDRQIFRLAIPNILTNMSVPLISSVDTALMGGLSVRHLGAMGLGAMIFNFLYWNFGFLRMGTTGMTAQAYGAKKENAVFANLLRGLITAFLLAALLIVFQKPLIQLALYLLRVPEDLKELTSVYFSIRIFAAPASLGLYVVLGWYFGRQNARFPMVLTIIINVVNVFLSYYFVQYREWSIQGVAWGTVAAQYLGLLIGLSVIFYNHHRALFRGWRVFDWKWSGFRDFMVINRDIFIRTLFLSTAFAFFNAQSAEMGTYILAANVIFLQFLNWMSYGIDGFAFATESVVGKYLGEQNSKKLDQTLRRVFLWGLVVAGVYMLIYGMGGRQLFALFTDEYIPNEFKQEILLWVVLTPLLAFWSYIWDGVFVGMTASVAMRNSMIFAFILYIAAHYSCMHFFGLRGMFIALNVFLVGRALFQFLLFKRRGWSLK
ncbi:MAG TPA: MATE family efflux transporter [Saprospiraceae bacterium]|nr:MATE family efflux transporter [Saprospiraceae bacterium]